MGEDSPRSKFDPTWPLAERLKHYTTRRSGCLEWDGNRDRDGYGLVWHANRRWAVHRLAWVLHNGPIARGAHVLHACDNPACCAIEHLRLGNHRENMLERNARGRTARGQDAGRAKLTDKAAMEIYSGAANGETFASLAERFRVSPRTVWGIAHGRSWKAAINERSKR